MNEVIEKRAAVDVFDELHLKLGDINSVLDIMTTCDSDECDVNGAAFAIQRMVEGAKGVADELYRAPYGGAS